MTQYELFLVLSCLFLGGGAGFLMHRSDFCMAGIFRDYFLFRNATMLRSLLLAVVASMLLFEVCRELRMFTTYPFPFLGAPSLANLLGGGVFGVGMVLAGGCVVGTIYRLGTGSLLSGLAVVGMVAGSAFYAEIHPLWRRFYTATEFTQTVTLPQWLGLSPTLPVFCLSLLAGWFFLRWRKQGLWSCRSEVEGYIQPWKTAMGLAVLGLFCSLLTGMPLGITTAYAKMGAAVEQLVWPGHVNALEYFNSSPTQIAFPLAQKVYYGGPGPATDAISLIQYPLIIGILLGSAFSALGLREFRIHWRFPMAQGLSVLLGGGMMGLACRLAPACNIWHILGGLPILAWQSVLFVLGMIPGAWLGSRILVRFILKA